MSPNGRDRGAKRISIVLTDDHAVVRGALRALLEAQDDLEVVGEAEDLASARVVSDSVRGRSSSTSICPTASPSTWSRTSATRRPGPRSCF